MDIGEVTFEDLSPWKYGAIGRKGKARTFRTLGMVALQMLCRPGVHYLGRWVSLDLSLRHMTVGGNREFQRSCGYMKTEFIVRQ